MASEKHWGDDQPYHPEWDGEDGTTESEWMMDRGIDLDDASSPVDLPLDSISARYIPDVEERLTIANAMADSKANYRNHNLKAEENA